MSDKEKRNRFIDVADDVSYVILILGAILTVIYFGMP